MKHLDLAQVNQLVLRKHHLTKETKSDDIRKIAEDIIGLHATGAIGPFLSLFARARKFEKEDLIEELYLKRNLGKIRCMRKTLHILPKEMIPIVYAATREMVDKVSKRYVEFRVSTAKYEEFSQTILELLKAREMTATEIKKALRTQLDVSAILYRMCDQGLLIRGQPEKGWKDQRHKYALFHEYFPKIDLTKLKESEARTWLVNQYLRAFGPVTEKDIKWWTGFSKTKVQKALNQAHSHIDRVKISPLKGEFLILHADRVLIQKVGLADKQTINLLPSLDPYLMGYKERERYLQPEYYNYVFDRSGNCTLTILLDGRVIGVWDFTGDAEPSVKLFLFEEMNGRVLKEIYEKAQRIGQFMAEKAVLIEDCESMVPLTQRPAGGVMSPLKYC